MSKIIRNILVSLAIIAVLASIVGNLYYFGWLNLEKYLMQKGFNIAINRVIQTVEQTGQVQLADNLILIKQ